MSAPRSGAVIARWDLGMCRRFETKREKSWKLGIGSWGGLVRVGSLAKEKGQLLPLSRVGSDAVSTYEI